MIEKFGEKNLREQMNNNNSKEKITSDFEIIDIIPEKEKFRTPVIILPGWSTTPKSLENSLKLLSEKGRRVLSLAHTRKEIVKGSLSLLHSKKEILEPECGYSFQEIQKAFSILQLLEEKNLDKVDAVAYSEGGINVSIAAAEYPEKFRNIVYVNPAGMIGKDKFPKLFVRFSLESIKNAIKSIVASSTRRMMRSCWQESLNYIKENIPLSLKEAIAISHSDIIEILKSLKENGIRVAIIHGEKDKVFPIEKVKKEAADLMKENFYMAKGDHFEIISNPQEMTDLINKVLINLERE